MSGLRFNSNPRPHRPERRALPTALNPDAGFMLYKEYMQRVHENSMKSQVKMLFFTFLEECSLKNLVEPKIKCYLCTRK